jgi:Site-specific recombinase XerD
MKIQKFLSLYPNDGTVRVYRAGIYIFFDSVYGKVRKGSRVTAEEKEVYEKLSERYFSEQRDYFEDLLKFIVGMHDRPPISAKARISGVEEFLGYYGVEFTQRQRKQLSTKKPKGKSARTAEKDIETETLRKILTHLDLKGVAGVLVLASSGARIGELLQVKLSDVDLTTTPPEMVIRGEDSKSGDTRTVFISKEAKEALEEWLKVRDSYLQSAKNRNRGLVEKRKAKGKSATDDRLFPFSDSNVREMWENALRKAGLWTKDNSTGRSQIRIHGLRKFFRSQLALSCPVDIVEMLMGHEGYLTDAYRRYSRKQMGEYYLKAEHHVTVTGTGDLRELHDMVQDQQAAIEGYRGILSKQAEEMVEARKDIEALKAKEEARTPFDDKMSGILKRLVANPEIKELIRKELKEIS